jgi:hypothetical protein
MATAHGFKATRRLISTPDFRRPRPRRSPQFGFALDGLFWKILAMEKWLFRE